MPTMAQILPFAYCQLGMFKPEPLSLHATEGTFC
ncbi:hypothetical protein MTBSS4_730009 [Magnetospirillum sp. SS-4]|nr:hypothetical protein MTBSS4_730009 [Magnetospirillum sp. SS-4]